MQALSIVDGIIRNIDMNQDKRESKEQESKNDFLLMIPGPIEFDQSVYASLARKTVSHVAPSFINEFGEALERFGEIIGCDINAGEETFILSGGGSLGWDCIVSGLTETELSDRVLILNSGYFSDNFKNCAKAYGLQIDEIKAQSIGDVVTPKQLSQYLSDNSNPKPKLIAICHVDTSVAACSDVEGLSKVCRSLSPKSFIAVDGVCSFAAEQFKFNKYGIDICMTASQKAFGTPPGLCMMGVSSRAIDYMQNGRKNPIRSWYANLNRWLPIMRAYRARKPSYFSTPNVNLIIALNQAMKLILSEGIENVIKRHTQSSGAFQKALASIGLEFVAVREDCYASTISAVKFPKNVNGKQLLTIIKNEKNIIFAGGLHKEIKSTYFRVGHMGISTRIGSNDMLACVEAIEYALDKCGYAFQKGTAIKTFKELSKQAKL